MDGVLVHSGQGLRLRRQPNFVMKSYAELLIICNKFSQIWLYNHWQSSMRKFNQLINCLVHSLNFQ
jgi:hypothetical protein